MKRFNYLLSGFHQHRASAGFTLVEGLVSCVIGLVIMGMIMILYVRMNENMLMGVALAEINSDARTAMDRIVRDVRWGAQLEVSRDITGDIYTTGDDELIIKIPSIDTAGKVIPSTYDYVIYALDASDSTKLKKIIDPDIASDRTSFNQVITGNLNSFSLSSEGVALGSVSDMSSIASVEVAIEVNKNPLAMVNKSVSETIISNVVLRNN